MHISDEQVEQFRQLYFKRYGKEISREDAYEQGLKLLRLVQIIYKPITETQFETAQIERMKTIQSLIADGSLQKQFDDV